MSFFTNATTNASTTAASLTWNQKTYNKIICHNNKTKDWASKIDCIIQAIEAMAGLEKKAKELVRIADIINNTIADTETGTLLAGKGYRIDITVTLQANFPWKIIFDTLYTNGFSIRICSRTLSISSERNIIR